ncbi:MAG: T9SS type A sorting domain-containing protein [Flavobacteriales bacterium]|nr:T9SS type A sorting domain-containing protein [Flavobacteriales bacterium]
MALCLVGTSQAQTYCPSDGGSGNTFNIARVQFADLDNVSGDNNGYADFSALSATVQPGSSNGITVDPNGPFFLRYRWNAWIDWNNDGTFGAGELVFQSTGFGTESGSISVPAGVSPGAKRMRVNMSAFTYRGACANYSTGEVEDYTVNVVAPCDAAAGTITAVKPDLCLSGSEVTLDASADGNAVVPAGYQVVYVLTSGPGLVIQQASATPTFTVSTGGSYTVHTLVYDPSTLDLSVVVPGVTTGFDVNSLLIQGGGAICASLDVAGAAFNVSDPNAGTLSGGADVCSNGSAVLTATANGDAYVPAGYSQAYVLTSGAGLVIEQLGAAPEFTVTGGGLYTIHSFVFPTGLDLSVVVPGVTTGFDVNGLLVQGGGSLCASLDVAGAAFNVSDPNAGTLSGGADVCSNGSAVLTATANGDANVPAGYSQAYVLTSGAGLVIEQLGAAPEFTVTGGGLYTIHSFVFPTGLDLSVVVPGVTTGFDVNGLLVQGGGSLCASLDVAGAAFNVSDPNAGTLSGGADVCSNGSAVLTATANGDANVPAGYSQAYVLISGAGLVIEQLGAAPEFTVTGGGLYTIHSFVFPTGLDLSVVVPGVTTGFDVNGLLVQGGGGLCASLDVAGAAFNVSDPNAGTLSGGADVCSNGSAVLTATANGDAYVPAGYSQAYVLTSGAGLVIEQLGAAPEFTVTGGGLYTIHSFVFPTGLDLSVVVPGVTTGFDVNGLLVQGGGSLCASLDVAGAAFNVSDPNAGTLSGGADVCSNGSAVLTATANGDANVPAGYSQAYVLTSGAGLVIEQLGAAPEFTVTGGGLYTIHSFVFPTGLDLSVVVPGVTTGFDVNGLLVQGGGSLCASLDVAGAAFNVSDPNAGTLSGGADVCSNGSAVLTATANGDAYVPAGYSQAYVLTSGAGLVIEQLGATPEFTVTGGGLYTIHSFVFPTGLDLSVVVPGVTTGFDVNGLLVQGGGSLCASLDVAGAAFNVSDPNAGTLTANSFETCLENGSATISATANGDANVPAGYSQAYVLTSGAGLVIEQLGATPEFTVTTAGLYTIHSFVFPTGLDLSVVVPGVTTGFDVNGLLVQGGGSLCASLDVAGAPVQVIACEPVCEASAGTITASSVDCLGDAPVTLNGLPNNDAVVPAGYQVVYVLTEGAGLVIVNAGADPSFEVNAPGLYTIHTLVYDPATLDLSIVVPGVTTGFDVNGLLIQGGGTICASLDVAGAQFEVTKCVEECTAQAGDIAPEDFIVCRVGGQATVTGVPAGNALVPAGYQTLYVLTRGQGLVINAVNTAPTFTVSQLGLYRIHTLVYDPATLDLSGVQFGVTTGFDVNGLLQQGGGEICASLDVQGAPFLVVGPILCSFFDLFRGNSEAGLADIERVTGGLDGNFLKAIEEDAPFGDLTTYPNPTRDLLNVDINVYMEGRVEVAVMNMLGQEARPTTSLTVATGANRTTIDVSDLRAGTYFIRLTAGDKVVTQQFVKMD